jgi:hypothetical protein
MVDPRVRTLVRDNKNMRLHVLLILWGSPEPLSAKDISDELDCHADTVEALLPRMLKDQYVSKWESGRHPKWWLGDRAGQLLLPGLRLVSEGEKLPLSGKSEGEKLPLSGKSEGEKLPLSVTRSIDLYRSIDQGRLSRLQAAAVLESDPEVARRAAVTVWCNLHAVTGEKRRDVLAEPCCTVARLDAWLMHWKGLGCTAKGKKFYNKWGPLNYAIRCCLNGDEPPSMAAAQGAAAAPAGETLSVGDVEADELLPVGDVEKEDVIDLLLVLWDAICDRVFARDPELFTKCFARARVVSLAGHVLTFSLPVSLYRLFFANEKNLLAMVADVLDDDGVQINANVWGVL